MQKIVIAGSAKLQDKINYWLTFFKEKNYKIIDYPKDINKDCFLKMLK